MPIQKTDLLHADLPPLADVRGTMSLEKHKLPSNFADVPQRLEAAVQQGKRVIILNAVPTQDKKRDGDDSFATENVDMYQFALRGIANDPRFNDYLVISPDDRTTRADDGSETSCVAASKALYQRLGQLIVNLEEDGAEEDTIVPTLSGKEGDTRKGVIMVFTPQILSLLYQLGPKMQSKVARLFGLENAATIDITPSATNLYEAWDKYAITANVDEIRRLLIEAATFPMKIPGVIPRANKPGPTFKQQPQQKSSEEALLRMMQRGLFLPGRYIIHGEPGRGKTTWLAALNQLATQAGYDTFYARWAQGQNSFDNFPVPEGQWKKRTVKELVRVETKAEDRGYGGIGMSGMPRTIPSEYRDGDVYFATTQKMLFVDQADCGKDSVKEESKVVNAGIDATVFMTSNRPPNELAGAYSKSILAGVTNGRKEVTEFGKQPQRPIKSFADVVRGPMIAQKLEGSDWAEVETK